MPPALDDYEYEDYVYTFTGGGFNMSNFGGFTWAGVRHESWSQMQDTLLIEIRERMAKGWEPLTEIGPSAFKYRETYRLQWGAYILAGLFTMGVGFLCPFFFLNQWAMLVEFRVKMRRLKKHSTG